jgi:DNA primase
LLSPNEIDYEAIKRDISITEVLSRYVRTFNRDRYRVPCPIHGGDGYNFAVDERKGLFHCFKCDAAGDVIRLYSLLENISDAEAARRLTDQYRIAGSISATNRQVFNQVRDWNKKIQLPEVILPKSQSLNGYRHYSSEAIQHFNLGLVKDCQVDKFWIELGVLIPIKDIDGRNVGFAIRQVNALPKYLNNSNLKKSEVVYGLWENKQEIASRREAIVCEGQFSAIRVWDSGFRHAVATMGASMSPSQAHLLAPFVSKIIVLYDGDKPDMKGKRKGEEGARKIKEDYSSLFKVDIRYLPTGTDPDNVGDLNYILQ